MPANSLSLIRIVDDDAEMRESLEFLLSTEGWKSRSYASAEAFLETDDVMVPGCLILDIRMPGLSGLQLQELLKKKDYSLPILFITAHGDITMAVEAVKNGAFDYITNTYRQSLANLLTREGYSAKTFHYNDPSFYSRGVFSPAMGYSEYVCYGDYIGADEEDLLYDDQLLFDNPGLNAEFFREGQPALNFIITRSAHLSYKYNEVLSYWALKKYPEFRGLTGNEETDCAYLKARLVDDLFARLLQELEDKGQLDNTVIIGVTDHYTYGYKDEASLYALSGVDDALLLEKTPCFIWSADLQPMKVDKTLNTSDLLPTMLNLLGVDSPYDYIGRDAFDPTYEGYALFSDGSWISGDIAYDAGTKRVLSITGGEAEASSETLDAMAQKVQQFVRINNLILDTDYYKDNTAAN